MTKRITLKEAEKLRKQQGVPDAEVLTAAEIEAVVDTPTLEATAKKHSGRVLNDLLKGSAKGDTQASKEILERAHGKVAQGLKLTTEITIKALHMHVLEQIAPAPLKEPSTVSGG